MRVVHVDEVGYEAAAAIVRRRRQAPSPELSATVADIVAQVARDGDAALLALGRRFDAPGLATIEVSGSAWDAAIATVPQALRVSLGAAAARIERFHRLQQRASWFDTDGGIMTGQLVRPLERVGVYAPGGRAPYPSTVLMCAIPARCAGVREVVLCTPASRDGAASPAVLLAARLAGVSRVFLIGGAQAVAALAIGTDTVAAVEKVVGPGNAYVNEAKRQLAGVVEIDMLAGASEVCIVADETATPAWAAADLLTQLEHDPDCVAFFLATDAALVEAVRSEIDAQCARLDRRAIVQQALAANCTLVVAGSTEQAMDLANACAPEHLTLMVRSPLEWLGAVRNAGAVLLGHSTPQTLGDYLAGPSHTLPTGGAARCASPVSVDTFIKRTSVIACSPAALSGVAGHLCTLARSEGFDAHARAVELRTAGGEAP